jgi:choline dehydrogenase-like flavoprotein
MCASTLATSQILLNSTSAAFPNGLANSSGTLGNYLMDHTNTIGGLGVFLDNMDSYYHGNRPNNIYIPRFRNLPGKDDDADFVRGYGYQGMPVRADWSLSLNSKGFGADFKNTLRKPGYWLFALAGFGECLPQKSNRVFLDRSKPDRFGIPQVSIEFSWSDNELAIVRDLTKQGDRLMKAAGAVYSMELAAGDPESELIGGGAIHEMGTARMGNDPTQSVLNAHNQAHDVSNLFITDGSCMTSSSCVNPSLTYMALTARACDYAVKQLAAGQI